MLDGITYGDAESEQKNLSDRVERDSKDDVTEGPAVIESPEYENELRDGICGDAKDRPDQVNDEESGRLRWREWNKRFEGGDRDEERRSEDDEAGYPKEPKRNRCPVFSELESNEPVDEKTAVGSCY